MRIVVFNRLFLSNAPCSFNVMQTAFFNSCWQISSIDLLSPELTSVTPVLIRVLIFTPVELHSSLFIHPYRNFFQRFICICYFELFICLFFIISTVYRTIFSSSISLSSIGSFVPNSPRNARSKRLFSWCRFGRGRILS